MPKEKENSWPIDVSYDAEKDTGQTMPLSNGAFVYKFNLEQSVSVFMTGRHTLYV